MAGVQIREINYFRNTSQNTSLKIKSTRKKRLYGIYCACTECGYSTCAVGEHCRRVNASRPTHTAEQVRKALSMQATGL